jgi:putative spermidine/putrescine transport system ATP-binding protein
VTAGLLALHGITRRFGDHAAVEDVSFEVAAGELLALIGASGSGKTTTLRIIAGHERPDAGTVRRDGNDITTVSPQKRDFGMVFQHYALFPHMSVQDNVAFGLEARGVERSQRRERAQRALATVGLERAGPRPIQSLSGGEQQRVALARALVIEPRVLLLDEPLSNLDPTLRRSMRDELRSIMRTLHVTAVFVTHDQDDAFAIADRVALMKHGRLLQVGTPEDLYARPATRDVAEFIGRATLVDAVDAGTHAIITVNNVERRLAAVRPTTGAPYRKAFAVLRPEALGLVAPETPDAWRGIVMARRFAGSSFVYRVALNEDLAVDVATPDGRVGEADSVGVVVMREPIPVVSA